MPKANNPPLILDRKIIAEVEELLQEQFASTIQLFLQDTQMRIQRMEHNLQNVLLNEVSTEAHTLKSSARYLGASALAEAACSIELQEKNHQSLNDYRNLLEELKSIFIQTQKIFLEMIAKYS